MEDILDKIKLVRECIHCNVDNSTKAIYIDRTVKKEGVYYANIYRVSNDICWLYWDKMRLVGYIKDEKAFEALLKLLNNPLESQRDLNVLGYFEGIPFVVIN